MSMSDYCQRKQFFLQVSFLADPSVCCLFFSCYISLLDRLDRPWVRAPPGKPGILGHQILGLEIMENIAEFLRSPGNVMKKYKPRSRISVLIHRLQTGPGSEQIPHYVSTCTTKLP